MKRTAMTHVHINWRLASRLSVVTMAVLVVLVITLVHMQQSESQASNIDTTGNTDTTSTQVNLDGAPAPNFTLTDQNGQRISLSQFKGKPVVLTFLYTHCPDVCPLTAEHLHTTMQQLGSRAQGVAILAVSTDPQNDTPAAVQQFTEVHHMAQYWHYLTGTQKQLSPVWSSYDIYVKSQQKEVNHSMAVFVIDQSGKERTYFDSDFTANQLTATLQGLLK